ncbi:MAG: MptD family putative ECF transporter S component [Pseudomonadota bacterium]
MESDTRLIPSIPVKRLRADKPAGQEDRAVAARPEPERYWEIRELAVIGIFSALTKVASLMVALVGGGMNPLTLVLKNLLFTALMIVLLFKVRKSGTMLLFIIVNTLFAMLLMGSGFILLPSMLIAGLCAETVILLCGGYRKTVPLILGVAAYDLVYKLTSIGMSWLFMREQPQMLWMATVIIAIGYIGSLGGLAVGMKFVKELRHAGIIRD